MPADTLFNLAESLPHGYHASIVHCREGAYSSTLWRVIVLPNDRRHCRVKGRRRTANGATLADAINAAAALLAERPLDELPDLGPNPKSSRLRPQYVEKDAALQEDTDG